MLAQRQHGRRVEAELVAQGRFDAPPRPVLVLLLLDLRPQQLASQPPQRVVRSIVGKPERKIQRLVVVLQRERVVAVEVRSSAVNR